MGEVKIMKQGACADETYMASLVCNLLYPQFFWQSADMHRTVQTSLIIV